MLETPDVIWKWQFPHTSQSLGAGFHPSAILSSDEWEKFPDALSPAGPHILYMLIQIPGTFRAFS